MSFFFFKTKTNKQYLIIQIYKVHRYNTYSSR